jgi:hypothetical protein
MKPWNQYWRNIWWTEENDYLEEIIQWVRSKEMKREKYLQKIKKREQAKIY